MNRLGIVTARLANGRYGRVNLRVIQEASEAAEESSLSVRESELGSLADNHKPFHVGKFGPKLEEATQVLTHEEAKVIGEFIAAIETIDIGVKGLKVQTADGEIEMETWWKTTRHHMEEGNWKEAEDRMFRMLTAVPENTKFARTFVKVHDDIKGINGKF